MNICLHCKNAAAYAAGLCRNCYDYARKSGKPRPDYLFSDDPRDAHPTDERIARAKAKVREMGMGRPR